MNTLNDPMVNILADIAEHIGMYAQHPLMVKYPYVFALDYISKRRYLCISVQELVSAPVDWYNDLLLAFKQIDPSVDTPEALEDALSSLNRDLRPSSI